MDKSNKEGTDAVDPTRKGLTRASRSRSPARTAPGSEVGSGLLARLEKNGWVYGAGLYGRDHRLTGAGRAQIMPLSASQS